RRNADLLQRIGKRQRVDDRGQHAHVIGCYPIHAQRGGGHTPEDVAATHHDPDLHARRRHIRHLPRQGLHLVRVDAECRAAGQHLTAQLQQDALVRHYCATGSSAALSLPASAAATSPTLNRTKRAIDMFSPSFAIFVFTSCSTVSVASFTNGCSSRHTSS